MVASLGDLPPRPAKPKAHLVSAEIRPGFRLERLRIDNGVDGVMSALMLVPDGLKAPAPTILWLHSSSYDHHQLLQPNTNGGEEPLGVTFVKRGLGGVRPGRGVVRRPRRAGAGRAARD